jgi:peptidoglycan/LPS O-acetylase OafA/YrhL
MSAAERLGPTWLSVTWSLAVEEQFYLTLPLLIRLCPPRRLPHLLGGLIVLAPILRLLTIRHVGSTVALFVLLPYRMDALLLGVLCAYLLRQESVRQYLQRSQVVNRLFWVLLAGAFFMTFTQPQTLDLGMVSYGYSWFALLYTCFLILALTQPKGKLSRMARVAPLRTLGILAYGVFLFHDGINGVIFGLFLDHPPVLISRETILATLLSSVVTILLAHLSWHYFEKRLVSLGHRVKYDVPSLPEPQPGQQPEPEPEPQPVAIA